MAFKAGKQILVTREGKGVNLQPGDPVPEAAGWPQDVLLRCMRVGQVLNVPDDALQDVARPRIAQEQAVKFELAGAAAKAEASKATTTKTKEKRARA